MFNSLAMFAVSICPSTLNPSQNLYCKLVYLSPSIELYGGVMCNLQRVSMFHFRSLFSLLFSRKFMYALLYT